MDILMKLLLFSPLTFEDRNVFEDRKYYNCFQNKPYKLHIFSSPGNDTRSVRNVSQN